MRGSFIILFCLAAVKVHLPSFKLHAFFLKNVFGALLWVLNTALNAPPYIVSV